MEDRPPECLDCRRSMEAGYLLDHGYGAVYPSAWVSGRPAWSRWTGLKLKGRVKMPVTTFRCPECGRLASFARASRWPG